MIWMIWGCLHGDPHFRKSPFKGLSENRVPQGCHCLSVDFPGLRKSHPHTHFTNKKLGRLWVYDGMWFWMRRTQIHDWAGLNVFFFVTVLVTGRSIAKHLVPTSQEYDDFTRFWTSDDVAPPGFARLAKDRHRAIFDPDGYGYGSRAWYTLEGGRLESLYVGIAYICIELVHGG